MRTDGQVKAAGCALALLTALAAVWAQTSGNPQVRLDRIRADLDYLCSRELQGRVSLQPGADSAARYVGASFAKAGLKAPFSGSYFQTFRLVEPHPDHEASRIVLRRSKSGPSETFRSGPDFRGSFRREFEKTAAVVFAGYGITAPEYGYDDYAGIDVKNKAVLIFSHEPQEADAKSPFLGRGLTLYAGIQHKVMNAQRHGAVMLLIAPEPHRLHRSAFEAPSGQPKRGSAPGQSDDATTLPVVSVSTRVCDALLASAGQTSDNLQRVIDAKLTPASQAIADVSIDVHLINRSTQKGESRNVVGVIEGSNAQLASETILVTSHYDHLPSKEDWYYPGANDNASGTVAVMELVRLFSAATVKPKRTIAFISFGSEEEGMLGSYYYADHSIGNTKAVINLDMIGRDEAHTSDTQGRVPVPADTSDTMNIVGGVYSPQLRALLDRANRKAGLQLDNKYDHDSSQNVLFRCDHLPFLIKGIPAVWVFGGFHPGYHEPSDTVQALNFKKLEKVTRLAYWAVRELADADSVPAFRAIPMGTSGEKRVPSEP